MIVGSVVGAGLRLRLPGANALMESGGTILWLLAVVNAFNFIDNMNGLCSGVTVIAAGWLGACGYTEGNLLLLTFSAVAVGAVLGFLPYNYPAATAFLGDSGSHLLGYLVGAGCILLQTACGPGSLGACLLPLFIPLVPLVDLCWVVGFRTLRGRPFYVGDTNHLSHRLVASGLSAPRAVALLWVVALVLGGTVFFYLRK